TLVVALSAWLVVRFRSMVVIKALTALCVVAILTVAHPIGNTWAASEFDDDLISAFGEWRARIPPGTEVLWIESGRETAAINTWLLLERPTYISTTAAPNALFSRPAAIEMVRRAEAVAGLLPFFNPFRPGEATRKKGPFLLEPICRTLDVRYVVTSARLADATPIPAPATAPPPLRDNGLY